MANLIICGISGRMGQRMADLAQHSPKLNLLAGVEQSNSPSIGLPAGKLGVVDNLSKIIDQADVMIDFTSPEGTLQNLKLCIENKKPIVIGTTGFTDQQRKEIEAAAKKIPIVFSPNMSIGVNVMFRLTEEATRLLGKDFDVKIHEIHHNQKKDAPSGTAKKLQEIVEKERNSSIRVTSERTGDVVGDHTVYFEGTGERLEIFHHASSRDTFAQGALRAAEWLVGQKPGFYNMQDVLGLIN